MALADVRGPEEDEGVRRVPEQLLDNSQANFRIASSNKNLPHIASDIIAWFVFVVKEVTNADKPDSNTDQIEEGSENREDAEGVGDDVNEPGDEEGVGK